MSQKSLVAVPNDPWYAHSSSSSKHKNMPLQGKAGGEAGAGMGALGWNSIGSRRSRWHVRQGKGCGSDGGGYVGSTEVTQPAPRLMTFASHLI
jgi:hypothetical protein